MGRFWIDDDFIDVKAKDLSIYAQMVFIALSRHTNKNGETFVGYRKIASLLNISKTTVQKAVEELEAYHLVVRFTDKNGRPSHLRVGTVPSHSPPPYHSVVRKEGIKEIIKEEDFSSRKRAEEIKTQLRAKFGWRKKQ